MDVDVAQIVRGLTKAQREAVLVIRPNEERRAINFSGNSANALCASTRRGGPLLARELTCQGRIAWYRLTDLGQQVRAALDTTPGAAVAGGSGEGRDG